MPDPKPQMSPLTAAIIGGGLATVGLAGGTAILLNKTDSPPINEPAPISVPAQPIRSNTFTDPRQAAIKALDPTAAPTWQELSAAAALANVQVEQDGGWTISLKADQDLKDIIIQRLKGPGS